MAGEWTVAKAFVELGVKDNTQQQLGKIFSGIGQAATSGGSLGNLFGGIGKLAGGAGNLIGNAIGGPMVGQLVQDTIGKVFDAIGAGAEKVVQLVGKASPVTMERMNRAFDDMEAVMGRVFIPIIEQATNGVRLLGDFLATILPSAGEVRDAFASLQPVFAELRLVLADVAPLIKGGITAPLLALTVAIKMFVDQVSPLLHLFQVLTAPLGSGRGLSGSYGASMHGPAGYSGFAELGRANALAAYSAGSGGGGTPEERTATAAETIATVVAWMKDRYDAGSSSTAAQIARTGFAWW